MDMQKENILPEAHRRWLEENYSRMYAYALSQLGNRADAEDAVCDTAAELLAKYGTLAEAEKFAAWTWGILRNILRRQSREQARRLRQDDIDSFADSLADTQSVPPADTLVMAHERGQVRKILAMLPENTRKAMEERYIRGRTYEEISGELEIPLSTVTWRIHEGKKQMRKEWENMELDTYMKDGYYTPADLRIDIRWRKKAAVSDLRLETIREKYATLGSLLAKNIAAVCYDSPKTVTDISRILGVPAVYIEEILAKLLGCELIRQTANRYQTDFPIIGEKLYGKIGMITAKICQPLYEKWSDALVKTARESDFTHAITGPELTDEEKAYILLFGTGSFGRTDPFSDDGSLVYPHENGEAAWCVRAYTETVDPEAIFPILHFFLDHENTAGERVELHFDAAQDWSSYQEAERFDELVGKVRSGEIRALLYSSREDFLSDMAPCRTLAAMQYEDQLGIQEELTKAVSALFPERFRGCEAYVNCEIRNFILAGWENYLLEKALIIPAAYIIYHRKKENPASASGTEIMY